MHRIIDDQKDVRAATWLSRRDHGKHFDHDLHKYDHQPATTKS
jgi:hypothetical protein